MAMARRISSHPASKARSSSGTSSVPAPRRASVRNPVEETRMRFVAHSALIVAAGGVLLAQPARTTWKEFLGGPDSSHYSGLKQITPANADKLEIAWSYSTGDDVSYTFSPLVVDNVAYVAAKNGSLAAIYATNGKELWIREFSSPTGGGFGRFGGISGQRGANYWESKDRSDRRIFVSSGGFLQAINAKTGKLVESFADQGRLDLKTGIDRAPRPLASRS